MSILSILLALGIGFYAGVEMAKLYHRDIIKKILKDAGVSNSDLIKAQNHIRQEIADESAPIEVNVNVEQHSGCYYAFRKDNDEFLGQGEDYVNLLTALQRRLGKDHIVNLDYSVARDIKGFPQVESTKVE